MKIRQSVQQHIYPPTQNHLRMLDVVDDVSPYNLYAKHLHLCIFKYFLQISLSRIIDHLSSIGSLINSEQFDHLRPDLLNAKHFGSFFTSTSLRALITPLFFEYTGDVNCDAAPAIGYNKSLNTLRVGIPFGFSSRFTALLDQFLHTHLGASL